MRCEEVRDGFAEYLGGSLDADAAKALAQHVSSCAECQAEFAGLERSGRRSATRRRRRYPRTGCASGSPPCWRPSVRLRTDGPHPSGTADPRGRRRSWAGEPLVQTGVAASLLIAGVMVGRVTMSRPVHRSTGQRDRGGAQRTPRHARRC